MEGALIGRSPRQVGQQVFGILGAEALHVLVFV